MGKPKVPKHKAKRKSRKGVISPKRGLLFWLLAGATLLGGFAAIVTFLPKVSVTISQPLDAKNPFSVSFTITNDSFIPLNEVNVSLGIGQVTTAPTKPDPNFIPTFSSRIVRPEWKNHALGVGEKFTITVNDIFTPGDSSVKVTGADLAIIVDYHPWFTPINKEKIFRFKGKPITHNFFYWYFFPLK